MATSRTRRGRAIRGAMVEVATYLGNTPTVARGSYVDPRVVDLYERGDTIAPTLRRLGGNDPLGAPRRHRAGCAPSCSRPTDHPPEAPRRTSSVKPSRLFSVLAGLVAAGCRPRRRRARRRLQPRLALTGARRRRPRHRRRTVVGQGVRHRHVRHQRQAGAADRHRRGARRLRRRRRRRRPAPPLRRSASSASGCSASSGRGPRRAGAPARRGTSSLPSVLGAAAGIGALWLIRRSLSTTASPVADDRREFLRRSGVLLGALALGATFVGAARPSPRRPVHGGGLTRRGAATGTGGATRRPCHAPSTSASTA